MMSHVRVRLSTDLKRMSGWERIMGGRGLIDSEACPREVGQRIASQSG